MQSLHLHYVHCVIDLELARNDSYVKRYLALLSANVIGTKGIRLSCKARDDNGQLDIIGNQIVEREFAKWCKKESCTVTGKLSFIDAQKLFVETLARDGECLVKHVKTKDNPYNYSIQFIEADHLDEEYDYKLKYNATIRMGVEVNGVGNHWHTIYLSNTLTILVNTQQ